MQEMTKILLGIVFLIIGYFVGEFLARITEEELEKGKKYFKLIIIISIFGVIVSLIAGNDVLLFSFAFIAIVTSRSIKFDFKNKITVSH